MKRKAKEPIPEEFESLEKAGEFWDTHLAAEFIHFFLRLLLAV